jgi:hypothetical protein
MEIGSQSAWVNEHPCNLGHEVIVANDVTWARSPAATASMTRQTQRSWPAMRGSILAFCIRFNTEIWILRRISCRFERDDGDVARR